jgi:hypothetical protein
MSRLEIRNASSIRYLTVSMVLLLLAGSAWSADKKPAAAPAAHSAPAAKPAASGGASHGASTASHSATTASHGPTTASHGATTASHGATTASHGTTTSTAGHSTTTAGHTTTTAGHTTGTSAAGHSTAATAGHTTGAAAGHTTSAGAGHPASSGAGHVATGPGGKPAKGQTSTTAKNGAAVTKRADGKVASLHDSKRNMDVHHSLSGNRRVVHERADHSRVVAERGGRGYVQRGYSYHGHEYAQRGYYYHGAYYHGYYGNYYYHGAYMYPYYPAYYYAPAYYGWVYNPWAAPISYGWGWGGNPWYGYYGAYFTPYPVYASASLWLTDYMISQSLQAAYQAAADAKIQAAALSNPAPLTPDVKQLIADEVRRQVALENAESANKAGDPDPASSSIQRMLSDGTAHVFIAGQDLDVVDAAGNECAISEGDALQLSVQQVASDATTANLGVLASKGGKECVKGDTVAVNLTDLQEMQNHMRQTIDQGMQDLQKKQGQGGLPAAPASAKAAPTESAMAAIAPPPPPADEVASAVNQESAEADKAEQEAGAVQAPPKTIAIGQSMDDVTGALGNPKKVVDLGPKKIYVYEDMKITFRDGKVSDVQ